METFLAVAEERSFSRAAARLHRTQPAVSQAIAKLEGELGEILFERSSRDGTLTDAGEVLREYAAKLLNLRGEAEGALTELRELHRGRLNLAANEYTCLYLLPLLDEFRRQNPRIKLAVQRGAQDYLFKSRLDSYLLPKALHSMIERAAIVETMFEQNDRALVTLNSIGDAVMSTDVNGRITYLNTIAEVLTGVDDLLPGGPRQGPV